MKIIFIGSQSNLDITNIGGIESTIRELSSSLIKEQNDVSLYIMTSAKSEKRKLRLKHGFVNLLYLTKHDVRKVILNSQYDVINFIQTPFENPIFIIKYYLKKKRENIIATKFFFTFPPSKKTRFIATIKSYFLIDINYVFSKRLYNEVKKSSEKVIKLLPPVSTEFYKVYKGDRNNDEVKLLFIGRLSKEKGLDIVLDIFKHINKEKYFTALFGYYKTKAAKQHYSDKISRIDINEIRIANNIQAENQPNFPPLWEFDILFLPYLSLESTLDTPLLILEGLVSNCKVITTGEGFETVENPNLYKLEKGKSLKEVLSLIDFVGLQDWVDFDKEEYSAEFLGSSYLSSITKEFQNAG